jgi:hypothetical protein
MAADITRRIIAMATLITLNRIVTQPGILIWINGCVQITTNRYRTSLR